jgi:hypothetical protein
LRTSTRIRSAPRLDELRQVLGIVKVDTPDPGQVVAVPVQLERLDPAAPLADQHTGHAGQGDAATVGRRSRRPDLPIYQSAGPIGQPVDPSPLWTSTVE